MRATGKATTALRLDHVFVLCAEGAPEAQALLARGFREGSRNVHPGQGTANRRFFFDDVYLELLWVDDGDVARAPPARRTRLWERWSQRGAGASPFGLVVRKAEPLAALPFPTWDYRPAYLPEGVAIGFAADVPLAEPAIAVLPPLPDAAAATAEARDHAGGIGALRGVTVRTPAAARLAPASRHLRDACGIAYRVGPHALELDFAAARSAEHDLRPALPLVIRGIARADPRPDP